jgi:hypothetical protein
MKQDALPRDFGRFAMCGLRRPQQRKPHVAGPVAIWDGEPKRASAENEYSKLARE